MTRTDGPVRALQIVAGDLRPYRIKFLERLDARGDVDLKVAAGPPARGVGNPELTPEVAVEVLAIDNHFWPSGAKVMWQSGVLGALRSDVQVIVCPEVVHNLTIWAIRLLHRRFGKKLVLTGFFYRPDRRGMFEPLRGALRRFLRRSASALVPYTDRGRMECISGGFPDDRIFVTMNTLDTEHLMRLSEKVTQKERDRIGHVLGGPDHDVVAFLGRLRPGKRVDILVDAVALLQDSPTPVTVVVIGDGTERADLESQARHLPIYFVGGTYDERLVALYLSVSKLMVVPGAVGLTAVHAFAAGLPMVTTHERAVVQTPEYDYVHDGHNGVVLDQLDPELLAATLAGILADPARLTTLRKGALASAENLRMDRMVDSFATALLTAARS